MTSREPPAYLSEVPDERSRNVAQLRIPPHSIAAESSVLGALLLSNDAWDSVGDLLTDADFYGYQHRLIFAAIGQLANACLAADPVTVWERLKTTNSHDEAGGLVYLNSLAQYVPSAANIRRYAEIVREQSVLRRLVSASDEIATAAFNPNGKTVSSVLEESLQRLMAIEAGATEDDWESLEIGIVRVLDRIQDEADGRTKPDVIPTGLTELDERLDGGGRPGEVIVIGARPNIGKSAMGLTIAVNAAESGEPVGYWSGEMSKMQLNTRAMSMRSHIHLTRLKRPERLRDYDWPNITKGVEQLHHLPLHFNDRPGLTIAKMRSTVRRLKRKHGIRLLVVDHLGLMAPTNPRDTRNNQVGEISRGFKQLARELGIVVLLLVQLNREVEKRIDQKPVLSDLRDSGEIEQDADVVFFIHRPYHSKPDLGDEWKYYAELPVAKLRDGEPGSVHVMYVGENTRFDDWPQGTAIPTSQLRVKRAPAPQAGDL